MNLLVIFELRVFQQPQSTSQFINGKIGPDNALQENRNKNDKNEIVNTMKHHGIKRVGLGDAGKFVQVFQNMHNKLRAPLSRVT